MTSNKSLVYAFLYNIINVFFPILTLPFIFRAISPDVYGGIVYSSVLYQSLIALFYLSLTSYCIREYKKNRNTGVEKIYTIQFCFTVISFFIYVALSIFFEDVFGKKNEYVILYSASLISYFLYSDWIFFSEQEYKAILSRNIILKSLILVLVIVVINDNEDDNLYVFLLSTSYWLSNLLSYIISKELYKIEYKVRFSVAVQTFKESRFFIFSSMIGICYQYLDQIIISILLGNHAATYLNLYKQVIAVLTMLSSSYCRFKMPLALLAYNKSMKDMKDFHHRNSREFIMLVLLIALIFVFFGRHSLSLFVGDKFNIGYTSIYICTLLFISSSVAVYIDLLHSVPLHLERVTFISNIFVGILYFVLLIFVADIYGYNGVITSLFLAELCGVTFVVGYYFKRKIKWLKSA